MKGEVIITKNNKGFKDKVEVLMDKFLIIKKLPLKILKDRTAVINGIREVIAHSGHLAQGLPNVTLPMRAYHVGSLGIQECSHLDMFHVLYFWGQSHQHGGSWLVIFKLKI